jgi:hypothetical protein
MAEISDIESIALWYAEFLRKEIGTRLAVVILLDPNDDRLIFAGVNGGGYKKFVDQLRAAFEQICGSKSKVLIDNDFYEPKGNA